MDIQHLHQVAQRAEDLDRAAAFYRDVIGLRHIASFDPPGLVFFDMEGTRLLLERAAPSSILYLNVPDIDAAVTALRDEGVEITSEPHRIFDDEDGTFGDPAEEWRAFVKDTEGNRVGLVERRASD